jgi:predicted RNase H-like nuclease (RuvC/YqgF family)
MKTLFAILVLCSLALAQSAELADDSADSVANAAKKSREAKSATAKKTYTNEDLPTSGAVNVVGPSATHARASNPAGADPVQEQKSINAQWQTAISQQKTRVLELQRQLDVAQQNLASSGHFYATRPNPNYEHYKQQVDSLTRQVEDAKKQLEELQDQAHKAGADKAYD